jgi:dienelactone hydrolase
MRGAHVTCVLGLLVSLLLVEAAMEAILAMPFVDRSRVVIGGQSRGGILSVAYSGRRAEQVKGVINLVGGWNGGGCRHSSTINPALFTRGARYPGETLWLYADADVFYTLDHSRDNFAAFRAAGGRGTSHDFPYGAGGHRIVDYPDVWMATIDAYLKRQGLPTAP